MRHRLLLLCAIIAAFVTFRPSALADTISREAQMAIRHVEAAVPRGLEQCDARLRTAYDDLSRAWRGRVVEGQAAAEVADARGELTYVSENARVDRIMACEHLAALWARRIELTEQGLFFESFPADVRRWDDGATGLLGVVGSFDDLTDRIVTVVEVTSPSRVLARARVVGEPRTATPAPMFIIDGLDTRDLRSGDALAVGDEPYAVVSRETRISTQASQSLPILRAVNLRRFGEVIADAGARSAHAYRITHPRPKRDD